MYIATLLIFFCNYLCVNSVLQCCQGQNILIDGTCSDGSNVTSLGCNNKNIVAPPQFEISDDDTILVENEEANGYFLVEADRYCLTKQTENGTEVALVCIADEVPVNATSNFNDGVDVFDYIKLVCAFITDLFLLAVLVVYLFIPELQDIEGKCILNLVASLCVAYLVIIFAPLVKYFEPGSCNTISFVFHILIVCGYNWLSVISFHLWRITIRPIFRKHINWFLIYLCYGHGVSLLVLIAALGIHHSHNKKLLDNEGRQCWVDEGFVVWNYVSAPLILMILTSIILQGWAAKKVWIDIDRRDDTQSVLRLRKKTLIYGHLLLIMGQALISEFILYVCLPHKAGLVMDINDCKNYMLGGVTFFILVVLRNKVLKALAKHGLCSWKFPQKWEQLVDEEREEGECDYTTLTRESCSL